MPWVRFDDQFTIHRKVDGLTDTAFRLHVAAIFWCARNLTDGLVPKEDLELVYPRLRAPGRFAAECVRRGVWHRAKEECGSEYCIAPVDNADGWVIHGYLEYQPARAKVLADRAAKAEAGRKGGIASGQSRRSDAERSKAKARPKQSASRSLPKSKQSASRLVEHPSRPVPSSSGSVVNPVQDRNGRASPDLIELITDEIKAATGRDITPDWAQRTADLLLNGRAATNPAAYVRQAIRSDPNPRLRFLPQYPE